MPRKTNKSKKLTSETIQIPSENEKDKSQAGESKSEEHTEQMADKADMLKNFAETTSRVVQQAASILEEEIASGIVAAKQVEERFIKVSELRSGKPDELMQRFRRDAHELVDILIDIITVATKSIDSFAQRVITIRSVGRQAKSEQMASGGVAALTIPRPIKAGETSEVPMSVENSSDTPTAQFTFHSSDLINASGDYRIPAQQIKFTPPTLTVSPHNFEKVTITVSVPEGTPPGIYGGLVQATRMDHLRVVLIVQVD